MSRENEASAGGRTANVPDWLVGAAAISWRLIVVGVVVFCAFRVLRAVGVVVIASLLALFVASILWIPVRLLVDRASWPPILAVLAVMTTAFAALLGVIAVIVPLFASSFDQLSSDAVAAWESLRDWLVNGPLSLTSSQVDGAIESAVDGVMEAVQGSALGGASAVAEIFAGIFLLVMVVFFVLKDGRRIVDKLLRRMPERTSGKTETALRIGWKTMSQYMAGVAIVGLVDATAIAIGLWIVGVPLVFPLAILVFFGAFFPLVGAFVSGLLAVAVALVNGGVADGLIILGIVVLVQQLEGDVVLPLVFGKTLKLHPLLILLGVAAGGLAFGLLGAFLAVPLIAVVVSVREALAADGEETYLNLARG